LGAGVGFSSVHGSWAWAVVIVSVVLAADSLVALVGPRLVFYLQAVLAALLLVTAEWASPDRASPALLLVVFAGGATIVLGMLAARHEERISEQSHPMNLPVFG